MDPISKKDAIRLLWLQGDLSYKLHSAQQKIYEVIAKSTERHVYILCSRRFGKSFLSAVLAIEYAIKNPGSKVIILAPNKLQAKEIFNPIIDQIAVDAPKNFVKQLKAEHKWKIGNSVLVLSGFETIKDALRGQGAGLIIVDEAGLVNPEQYDYVNKSVLGPILLHSQGKVIYPTTPPVVAEHGFQRDYNNAKEKFTFTIYDNPLLSEEQIEQAIKDSGGAQSSTFLREYMCEFIWDENLQVFPNFDPIRHVIDVHSLDTDVCVWVAVDGGGIRDNSGYILAYWDYSINKVVFYHSFQKPRNTPTPVMNKALDDLISLGKSLTSEPISLYGDLPGQIRVDLQSLYDKTIILPAKLDKDEAVDSLNTAFYNDRVVIANCKENQELISCLLSARFNKNRTDFERTERFGHADLAMAAVYAYRMRREQRFDIPIITDPVWQIDRRPSNKEKELNLIPEFGTIKFEPNTAYGGLRKK